MADLSFSEAANVLYAQADKVDAEIMELLGRIEEQSRPLSDNSVRDSEKQKIILSLEYMFARLRIMTESELVKIKKVLADRNLPAVLKPFFQSRSVYLAEISAKLTLYRDDIKVLDHLNYVQQYNN